MERKTQFIVAIICDTKSKEIKNLGTLFEFITDLCEAYRGKAIAVIRREKGFFEPSKCLLAEEELKISIWILAMH
jgi:hypothetical protein